MTTTTRYLVLASIVGLMTASVSQASNFSLVGAGDFANQSYSSLPAGTSAPSVSSKLGLGGGLLIDMPVTMGVQFEIGALYLTRKAESSGSGNDDITLTLHEIQVPVLLKFRLLPMFHIGVGGYWATAVGDIDSQDATTPADSNSSETYSSAGLKSSDYGLLGEAGFAIPVGGMTHFLIDARYAYGLANVSTDSETINNRDVQILVGFSFPFGGRRY